LTAVTRQLASPAPNQVLAALTSGVPDGTEYEGLTTALPADLVWNVEVASGIATVELPAEFQSDIPVGDLPIAFGQIVLTLTNRPGIGQVTFTVAGQPIAAVNSNSELTDAGAAVVCEDYSALARTATCG
jgi:spore germination protein GerM